MALRTMEEILTDLRDRVQRLERRGVSKRGGGMADSGWQAITTNFLSSTVYVRTIGRTVMMRGTTNTDIPIGTGTLDITSSAIATKYRPVGNTFGAGMGSGCALTVMIRPAGTVAVTNRNSVAITGTVYWSVTYLLG